MRIQTAIGMTVVGLVLGFAVTASPSWLSIGLLGGTLVIAGLAGLTLATMGRASHTRREAWHAIGPWLMAVGGALWLAIHPPYVRFIDLVSLGFIAALSGLVVTLFAGYLVSPWRGRGILASWLRPPAPRYYDDQTMQLRRPYDDDDDGR